MVLLELKKLKHVGMPWLQIYGKGALSLAASLVNISGGLIKDLEHRNETIRVAVSTLDVAACGPDVVDCKAYSSSRLRYQSSVHQSLVDTID